MREVPFVIAIIQRLTSVEIISEQIFFHYLWKRISRQLLFFGGIVLSFTNIYSGIINFFYSKYKVVLILIKLIVVLW